MATIHLKCNLPLPANRAAAGALGVRRYFTGLPCVNGHTDERNTTNGHCLQCDRDYQRHRMATDEAYRELNKRCMATVYSRIKADPVRLARVRENQRALVRGDGRTEWRAEYVQKPEVRAKRRARDVVRYHTKLKIDEAVIAAAKARGANWARTNKARVNAKNSARRATRLQATPPWLNADQYQEMVQMYSDAQAVSAASGVPYEVDHIVPLKGETVCGMHVPWNLQLLPCSTNRAKSNRLLETI